MTNSKYSRQNIVISIVLVLALLALSAIPFSVNALQTDGDGPEPTKIEIEKDVLDEGDTLRFYIYATDESGIDVGRSYMHIARCTDNPDEDYQNMIISYFHSDETGRLVAEYNIGNNWVAGKYRIIAVQLYDNLGNSTFVGVYTKYTHLYEELYAYIGVEPDIQNTEEPTSQKQEEPTTQKQEEPTSQKQEEPTSQKQEEPTSQKQEEPTTQKQEEPTTQKQEEPTTQKQEEPTTNKSDDNQNPYAGLPDGLNRVDGEWIYIRDEKYVSDFNGLVKHDKEFWYIENGKANFEYTGLVNSSPIEGYNDIRWYWVTKGVFDKTHNGAEPYLDRGTYLVENGYIDFHKTTVFYNEKTDQWMVFIDGMFSKNANGIYQNKYGWWKATNGIVTFKENGVFQNNFGWWRVKDSKVDFNAQGIYHNSFGWWKTTNGKVTFKENGVFQNEFGWWKVKDSKVDFSFTGIASNKYGSWYIEKGKVNFNKKGKVKYDGKTYTIKGGKVQ